MDDPIKRLGDLIAVQDEHSHVDGDARRRMGEIILAGDENEDIIDTARRIVDELHEFDLATLVADWLEVQMAV